MSERNVKQHLPAPPSTVSKVCLLLPKKVLTESSNTASDSRSINAPIMLSSEADFPSIDSIVQELKNKRARPPSPKAKRSNSSSGSKKKSKKPKSSASKHRKSPSLSPSPSTPTKLTSSVSNDVGIVPEAEIVIHIEVNPPPKYYKTGKRKGEEMAQDPLKFDPIKLKVSSSWEELLKALASCVDSGPEYLRPDMFQWRPISPKNAEERCISSNDSWQMAIQALQAHSIFVVTVVHGHPHEHPKRHAC
ncbi:hypothetical protein FRC02_006401 [Tulasnella sp. 418]|nr:hypothetical protein FRC02_006401 [Tulasnella sp. 418]